MKILEGISEHGHGIMMALSMLKTFKKKMKILELVIFRQQWIFLGTSFFRKKLFGTSRTVCEELGIEQQPKVAFVDAFGLKGLLP